jgi:hypothetical protein
MRLWSPEILFDPGYEGPSQAIGVSCSYVGRGPTSIPCGGLDIVLGYRGHLFPNRTIMVWVPR